MLSSASVIEPAVARPSRARQNEYDVTSRVRVSSADAVRDAFDPRIRSRTLPPGALLDQAAAAAARPAVERAG